MNDTVRKDMGNDLVNLRNSRASALKDIEGYKGWIAKKEVEIQGYEERIKQLEMMINVWEAMYGKKEEQT